MIKILLILGLSILSGIFGRMGGAEGYNTLYRDILCSLISVIVFCICFGFNQCHWVLYLIVFGLQWAALSTYYDKLFKFDNFWFSGFMMGLTLLPFIFIYKTILLFIIIRALLLAIIWGLLNKFLPSQVFIWNRAVAEEFLRYTTIILTYLIK